MQNRDIISLLRVSDRCGVTCGELADLIETIDNKQIANCRDSSKAVGERLSYFVKKLKNNKDSNNAKTNIHKMRRL